MDSFWNKSKTRRSSIQGVPVPVDSLILTRQRFGKDESQRSRSQSRSPLYTQAITNSHSSSSSSIRYSGRSSSSKSSHSSAKASSRSTRSRSYSMPAAPTVYPHDSISEAQFRLDQPRHRPALTVTASVDTRRYSQTGAPPPMMPFIPSHPYSNPSYHSQRSPISPIPTTGQFPQSAPFQRVSNHHSTDLVLATAPHPQAQWPQAGKVVVENGIMYVTARAGGGGRAKEWSAEGIRLVVVRRLDGGNVTIPANPKLMTKVRLETNGGVSVR